jgi:YVTN family beta-propeller protein
VARAAQAGNTSVVPENPAIVANLSVASEPYGEAYDPSNGDLYVTSQLDDSVMVLNGTKAVATIWVGIDPQGALYDPADGAVWVTVRWSDYVVLLCGTTECGTLTANGDLEGPFGMAYDPAADLLYVSNIDSDPGFVTVFNATSSEEIGSVATGTYVAGLTYDPANTYVYAADEASAGSGGSKLTVLDGLTAVSTVQGNLTNPFGVAYDASDGFVYVTNIDLANPLDGWVTVVNGTSVLGTIGVGPSPMGIAFDPGTDQLFVADSGAGNMTVLQGRVAEATVALGGAGSSPIGVLYAPATGLVYVTLARDAEVVAVSPGFGEGPPVFQLPNDPTPSTDIGEPFTLTTTLAPPGLGPIVAAASVGPLGDVTCRGPEVARAGLDVTVSVNCTANEAGTYTFWVTAGDHNGTGARAWAWAVLAVDPELTLPEPWATLPDGNGTVAADVGQTVVFHDGALGGTGVYSPVRWSGLPAYGCVDAGSLSATCALVRMGELSVSAQVTDSAGQSARSPPLAFYVYGSLAVPIPTATPTLADVGQWVNFSVRPLSGHVGLRYVWSGFGPATCLGAGTPSADCRFDQPGSYNVTVRATDAYGLNATSPPVLVTIDPLPTATTPVPGEPYGEIGEQIQFSTGVTPGSGLDMFFWFGLPGVCNGLSGSTPVCVLTAAGSYNISVEVVDSNDGMSPPVPAATFTSYLMPSVGIPDVSPASAVVGTPVTVQGNASGGRPPLAWLWAGLPGGCHGTNSSFVCVPSVVGVYEIQVEVVDDSGVEAVSPPVELVVTYPPPPPPLVNLSFLSSIDVGNVLAVGLVVGVSGLAMWWMGTQGGAPKRPR